MKQPFGWKKKTHKFDLENLKLCQKKKHLICKTPFSPKGHNEGISKNGVENFQKRLMLDRWQISVIPSIIPISILVWN